MARARNIKPGFYQNDVLAECSVWARLLFPGLWMMADREGRLEDRPARIKAAVLPYDSQNVDKLLTELHNRGFVYRYKVGGSKYIQIINFQKHQNPHCKEPESAIPAPDIEPDESGARTVREQESNSSGPADSGFPLTDSPSLIPDVPASRVEGVPIPEKLDTPKFREAWGRWLAYRREDKRAPVKPRSAATLLGQLADLGEGESVERINRSIANGWQGLIFPNEKPRGRSPPKSRADTAIDWTLEAANRSAAP